LESAANSCAQSGIANGPPTSIASSVVACNSSVPLIFNAEESGSGLPASLFS
jgi:hypothetical protein